MERNEHIPSNQETEGRLRQAIRETRFGSVTLVIQDGHMVQIGMSEKVRLK